MSVSNLILNVNPISGRSNVLAELFKALNAVKTDDQSTPERIQDVMHLNSYKVQDQYYSLFTGDDEAKVNFAGNMDVVGRVLGLPTEAVAKLVSSYWKVKQVVTSKGTIYVEITAEDEAGTDRNGKVLYRYSVGKFVKVVTDKKTLVNSFKLITDIRGEQTNYNGEIPEKLTSYSKFTVGQIVRVSVTTYQEKPSFELNGRKIMGMKADIIAEHTYQKNWVDHADDLFDAQTGALGKLGKLANTVVDLVDGYVSGFGGSGGSFEKQNKTADNKIHSGSIQDDVELDFM